MQLSEHFTRAEFERSDFAIRHGLDNRMGPAELRRAKDLCQHVLEPLRAHFGRPVILTSGFRGDAVNSAVGGSSSSQHSKGEAADLGIPGVKFIDVAKWIRDNLEFDQLIMEGTWVHVSYRAERLRKSVLTAHFARGKPTRYTPGL